MMNQKLVITIAAVLAVVLLLSVPMQNVIQLAVIVGVLALLAYGKEIKRWISTRQTGTRPPKLSPRTPSKLDILANSIFDLNIAEAKERCQVILDKSLERQEGALSKDANRLGESLRQLFQDWPAVISRRTGARLSGIDAAAYRWDGATTLSWGTGARPHDGYLQIGVDADNCSIIAWPGEDEIHIVRRNPVAREKVWLATYPSIYHWILIENGGE